MKLIILSLLVMSMASAQFGIEYQDNGSSSELAPIQDGKHELCYLMLARIVIDVAELGLHLAKKEYNIALFYAIKVAKEIQDDIQCFKEDLVTQALEQLMNGQENSTECFYVNRLKSIKSFRKAVTELYSKDFRPAVEDLIAAGKEYLTAVTCKDE